MGSKRISLVFIFIFLACILTSVRLFCIQVWHHEDLNTKVNKTIFKDIPEQPCRGTILDKNGNVLALSLKTYSLFADFKVVRDIQQLKSSLGSAGVAISCDGASMSGNSSFVVLAKDLELGQVNRIKALKIKGIGFVPTYRRQYPENIAAQLIGVVGKDEKGLEGIELQSNSYLSGESFKEKGYRDGRGRIIRDKLTDEDEYAGANVYLTIDRNIQFIAEQEIDRAWSESKAKKAMAVVQDPNTGEILALACRPRVDQNNFADSIKNLRNPVVSDVFEPGSTFKIITAAAALEEKAVKRSEMIWCENGSYKIFDHTIRDHEKKGLLTFDQVMECSSNIGTAKVGMRLGKQALYRYIRQFGFGSRSGIELPGEARGLLRPPDKWDGLSLSNISFGQGVGTTALQLVNAYSSIANGGELIEPVIIKEIKNPKGETLYKAERKVIRRTVSKETCGQLKEMLTGVVENGTGQLARIPGYAIGGKTGTAQKRDPRTNKYSGSLYVASFCGVAPIDNPALTILVVIDEPKGDYWGSTRAVPVFNRIAYKSLSYLRIAPRENSAAIARAGVNKKDGSRAKPLSKPAPALTSKKEKVDLSFVFKKDEH